MLILAAGEAEVPRSAAGHWGILAGLFVIYLIWRIDLEIRKRRGEVGDHSPTEPAAPAPMRDAEVKRVSSRVSPVSSRPRVERIGIGGYVSYEGTPTPPDDDEIDLPLDADDNFAESDRPIRTPAASNETASEYAVRCVGLGVEKAAIVKAVQEHFGLSRAQAYRIVGAAEGRPAGRKVA